MKTADLNRSERNQRSNVTQEEDHHPETATSHHLEICKPPPRKA
jgi:hypothetical protein